MQLPSGERLQRTFQADQTLAQADGGAGGGGGGRHQCRGCLDASDSLSWVSDRICFEFSM